MGRNNMSNNIDFKLKNAVEVGKDIKVTLGSITSSDIDLATGNYFADTLAANTTYTLSNAGAVQAFQLEVTGGSVGYDISAAVYDSVSFSVASQETNPLGLAFNNDGTKMYVVGSISDTVYQYSLSTAFDLSTASYDSISFSVASQEATPTDIAFNNDGTKMYIVGASSRSVHQYSLSTAFDLSTSSYDSVSFSFNSQDTSTYGIAFNNAGTKIYMVGNTTDSLYQYSLSTAFDVSTVSYDSVSFSVASQDTTPRGVTFNTDGTKMLLVGITGDNVYQYSLSTAFDLSTASYDSVSFSVALDTAPSGVVFNSDGTKMYILGATNDTIYQYSTATDTTLTWPSSIEWAGGVAPAAPANGETDVFTFVTDDSGTTYTGVKSIDNAS